MSKKFKVMLIIAVITVFAIPLSAFAVLTGSTSNGWNIYTPSGTGNQYRYGPSAIINADGSIDMWFASPGSSDGSQWDWIRYKQSTDGGQTWGAESVVLQPTVGGDDHFSCCDPGVVKFGGYYYIGYTSTLSAYGTDNDVYIARSTSPAGPFEKWNGTGWGGSSPKPFIVYDGPVDRFGAGEPSFVVNGSILYIYYTWISRDSQSRPIDQTRVYTADPSNANWPSSLTYRGVAINRGEGEDSTDVKYIDSLGKFVAASSAKRFMPESYIRIRESTDGITFTSSTLTRNYIQAYAHNCGFSGTETGHINTANSNFVAYAYGTNWGYWSTYLNPITYTSNVLPAVPTISSVYPGNGKIDIYFEVESGVTYNIKYGTTSGSYSTTISNITSGQYSITGLTNGTNYFIVMSATNSNGESGNTVQYCATPLAYSDAPCTSVAASSQISDWEASKAIDGNITTAWSSDMHDWGGRTAAEWITVDTGDSRIMKRATFTPRQNDEACYNGSFKIEVSNDNSTWTEINANNYTKYRVKAAYSKYVYEFNRPIYARYVRVMSNEMYFDPYYNYYFQFAEIDIEEIPSSITASSILSGWEAQKIIDGLPSTNWSSEYHSSSTATEWVCINMSDNFNVTGVRVEPRSDGRCFPLDFKFQSSTDGTTWTDIDGQSYTDYPNPGGDVVQSFKFESSVTAKYIRLYATKLSADTYSNYYCQFSEFYIDTNIQRTAVASFSLNGWSESQITDNIIGTCWSGNCYGSENNTEWIYVDIGSAKNISEIRIAPNPSGYCFPKDFKLQYSNDASTWADIPGQSYNGYYSPGSSIQRFNFSSLINARYFRVYATTLTPDSYGNYYFQLGEIFIYQ